MCGRIKPTAHESVESSERMESNELVKPSEPVNVTPAEEKAKGARDCGYE